MQRFPAAVEDVVGLYCDPAFYPHLDGLGKIGRPEVVDRSVDGSSIRMQVRFRFTADLPSAALAVVHPDRLTWIEDTTYDLDAATSATVIRPDHYADRLAATARSAFAPDGEGTSRKVTGELKVRALLVGGQVERAIVDGMREHLHEEAAVVARLLG